LERSLNLDALGAKIGNDDIDATLLDGPQAARGHAQTDETPLGLEPKTVGMQVRQKAAPLAVIRVGDRITRFWALTRNLADSRHDLNL